MDSELLLKFIGYFPDYLSTLSRTLLRLGIQLFRQGLSKKGKSVNDNAETVVWEIPNTFQSSFHVLSRLEKSMVLSMGTIFGELGQKELEGLHLSQQLLFPDDHLVWLLHLLVSDSFPF